MESEILFVSERGQVTIPQKVRKQIKVKYFTCRVENSRIILEPLQTRDEFFAELDAAEKDWEKNGGLTIAQMKKKYNL